MSVKKVFANVKTKIHNIKSNVKSKFNRTSVFSVKGVDNTTTVYQTVQPASVQTITPKSRTELDVKTSLYKISNQFGINVEDLIQMLENAGNCTIESLAEMDEMTFNKVILCLQRALKDSSTDGNVDMMKAGSAFIQFKNEIVHANKSITEAQAEVDKNKDKDFYDILLEKCPELQNKSIDNVTVQELKEAIRNLLLKKISDEQIASAQENNNAHEVAKDSISEILCKCSSEERAKIFAAISLLLAEENNPELKKLIPVMYKKQLDMLSKADPEQLLKFIQDCPELLEALLPHDIVEKLKILGLQYLPKEKLIEFRDQIIQKLEAIPAEDIQGTFHVIAKIKNGTKFEDLLPEEQRLYNNYSALITDIVSIFGAVPASYSPEEAIQILEPIKINLENNGVLEQLYQIVSMNLNDLSEIFRDYPVDKINEVLNQISNNKYGEVTGNVSNNSQTNDVGIPQRTSSEDYMNALVRQNNIVSTIKDANKSDEPQFLLITRANKTDKSAVVANSTQKYQSVKCLSAKDLFDGLANKYIKIDDVLDNYRDLSHSAKLFVNKMIEIMSPAEQNFRLDGMPNSEAVDIIKHSNINPEDLKLALDFASRKELEKIEENRASS